MCLVSELASLALCKTALKRFAATACPEGQATRHLCPSLQANTAWQLLGAACALRCELAQGVYLRAGQCCDHAFSSVIAAFRLPAGTAITLAGNSNGHHQEQAASVSLTINASFTTQIVLC